METPEDTTTKAEKTHPDMYNTFLESCCHADVKSSLTCDTSSDHFLDIGDYIFLLAQKPTLAPFFILYLEALKDITIKRGQFISGTQLCHIKFRA